MSLGTFRPTPYGRASRPDAATLMVATSYGVKASLLTPTYTAYRGNKRRGQNSAYSRRSEVRRAFAYVPVIVDGMTVACVIPDAQRKAAWQAHERRLNNRRNFTQNTQRAAQYVETLADRNARIRAAAHVAPLDLNNVE